MINKFMKILKKEETGKTVYYEITAEIKKGDKILKIIATFIENYNFNQDSSDYEFIINEEESEDSIILSKKDKEELESLAINYNPF
jgi:hypothetical protein